MEIVSNKFRPTIYSGEANHIAILTIGETTIPNENIKSIKLSNPIIDKTNDTFYIGTFISKQLEVEFYNADELDLTGQVHLSIGTYIDNGFVLTEDTEFIEDKTYYEYIDDEYIEYDGDREGSPHDLDLYEEDGDYEMLNIGYFNIETSPEDYYKNAKIVALDNGVKFKPNVDYSSAMDYKYFETTDEMYIANKEYYSLIDNNYVLLIVGTDYNVGDEIVSTTYERSIAKLVSCEKLLIWLCDYYDVELGTYPDINNDIEISTYDNSVSGKQYISYIAEIMGGNAQIGRDGRLYIIPFKRTPSVQINATEGKSWEIKDKYEITGITYFDALRDIPFSSGDDTGNILYIRSDNPFVVGDNEESAEIIQNIYDELVGTTIYNLKCENYADYSLDSWDFIEYLLETYVLTEDTTFEQGKTYYEYIDDVYIEYEDERTGNPNELGLYEIEIVTYQTINDNEFTYAMTIMGKVEVSIPNKQIEKTTNTIEGSERTKFNILKTIIDQQQNEIRIITGQSDKLESQINTLTASQQGLQNDLVVAGGTNLIRNSALFFTTNGESYGLTQDTEFLQDKSYYQYENYEYVEYTGARTGNPSELELYENSGGQTRYEYWGGELDRDRADNRNIISESGTVILAKELGAIQNVRVTPDKYTLSFKYKKLSPLSSLTVKINNETIIEQSYFLTEDTVFAPEKTYYSFEENMYVPYSGELTGNPSELGLYERTEYPNIVSDSGTIEKTILTTTELISVVISSTVDNGYCIYDLMLNKGELALEYSQNINETITDTVKIGEGISVESTSTETITRVDSDGFRVLNKNSQEVVLKATDTGTDTKTLTVRSWAEISGLRFQETDEQTWITGII